MVHKLLVLVKVQLPGMHPNSLTTALTVPVADTLVPVSNICSQVERLCEAAIKEHTMSVRKYRICPGSGRLRYQGMLVDSKRLMDYYLAANTEWAAGFVIEMLAESDNSGTATMCLQVVDKRDKCTVECNVTPSYTVGDVKYLIQALKGAAVEDHHLFGVASTSTSGAYLQDERTLGSYHLQDGSTIYLVPNLTGGLLSRGVPFVDVSNASAMTSYAWNPSAPAWRQANRGLCIEGKCDNRSCEAHSRMVICNLGFSYFDLLVDSPRCKCPMCQERVVPITCAFNNCDWKYIGTKLGSGGRPEAVECGQWNIAGDCYECFSSAANQVQWARLLIVTREACAHRSASECVICMSHVNKASAVAVLTRCRHVFHQECLEEWRIRRSTCPHCRADISNNPMSLVFSGPANGQ